MRALQSVRGALPYRRVGDMQKSTLLIPYAIDEASPDKARLKASAGG
ncbi:MAG: hypothetical protein U5K38_12290 [Woeseiaceae bacterium]|nr:hypothetical protein [Woeseiaceae bacterium]